MEKLFSQQIEKHYAPTLREQADELLKRTGDFPGWTALLILVNAVLFGSLAGLNTFVVRPVEFVFRLR
jgi:hypothetical protein